MNDVIYAYIAAELLKDPFRKGADPVNGSTNRYMLVWERPNRSGLVKIKIERAPERFSYERSLGGWALMDGSEEISASYSFNNLPEKLVRQIVEKLNAEELTLDE